MSFCANNSSNPKDVKLAVQALRRMVKHGRRAERILKALETQGHYDGKVFVLCKSAPNSFCVATYRFPAVKHLLREDIPGWSELGLDFGEKSIGSHGGSRFGIVPVYLRGKALTLELDPDMVPTGKIVTRPQHAKVYSARLGTCRMKSNGRITFVPAKGAVIKIRRSPSQEDAMAFAKVVAQKVANFNGAWPGQVPQPMLDLQKEVPGWLIEDGHIDRMMADIVDMIEVVKVMDE